MYIKTGKILNPDAPLDQQRYERDLDRTEIPLNEYDYVIHNNYSLEEFKQKVKQLTLSLLK